MIFVVFTAFVCMFIRHENFANYTTQQTCQLLNNIGLFLGFFSALGMCIVANFQVNIQSRFYQASVNLVAYFWEIFGAKKGFLVFSTHCWHR